MSWLGNLLGDWQDSVRSGIGRRTVPAQFWYSQKRGESPGDSYVVDEETDARMELNQVIGELERIADFAKEPDIRQYLFEIKAELEIEGITAE